MAVLLGRVTFDELQPHQLMLLLNEVLGAIDDRQKVTGCSLSPLSLWPCLYCSLTPTVSVPVRWT